MKQFIKNILLLFVALTAFYYISGVFLNWQGNPTKWEMYDDSHFETTYNTHVYKGDKYDLLEMIKNYTHPPVTKYVKSVDYAGIRLTLYIIFIISSIISLIIEAVKSEKREANKFTKQINL
jgi:hypothetical protein